MKKMLLSFVLAFLVLFAWAAKEGPKPQSLCPVRGEKIDKASYVDVQGQRVYFCCDACKSPFLKNSEAHFKKIKKTNVLLENIQVTCPVTGDTLKTRDFYEDYKGRRVFFCCDECEKEFKKQPEKVLKKLPGELAEAAGAPKEETPGKHDHGGHDHHHH